MWKLIGLGGSDPLTRSGLNGMDQVGTRKVKSLLWRVLMMHDAESDFTFFKFSPRLCFISGFISWPETSSSHRLPLFSKHFTSPPTSLCLQFSTSVSNKAGAACWSPSGRREVENRQDVAKWHDLLRRGNRSCRHKLLLSLHPSVLHTASPPPQNTATLVSSSSASSSSLSSAPLIISPLIVFIIIPSFSPVLLHLLPSLLFLLRPWIRLFVLSSHFLPANVESRILSHPLLWICGVSICRVDTEHSSRHVQVDFKGCRFWRIVFCFVFFYSEGINDHSVSGRREVGGEREGRKWNNPLAWLEWQCTNNKLQQECQGIAG